MLNLKSKMDSNLRVAPLLIVYHDLPKIDDFCNFSSYLSFAPSQHVCHPPPERKHGHIMFVVNKDKYHKKYIHQWHTDLKQVIKILWTENGRRHWNEFVWSHELLFVSATGYFKYQELINRDFNEFINFR